MATATNAATSTQSSSSSSSTTLQSTTSPTLSPATTTNGATSISTSSPTSSSTSSATTNLSSSSTTSTTASAVTSAQVITSGSDVVTVTSTVVIATGPSTTSSTQPTSHSFFSNTGAVAGVFSVVGLIVAALVIALIINAVRRRRAQKFDRDVAEAAAEAAVSSRSPLDEYNGGGGGGGYGYSDNSHGTYQLPPLSPQQNVAYGPSEMSQYDPYGSGAASLAASAVGRSRSRKDSEPGTPGLAGVGAGTLAREPSKRAPYHAFAGPASPPPELQGGNGTFRSIRGNQDILEAAGLAGAGIAPAAPSAPYAPRNGRSKFGSTSSGGHHPSPLQSGYPVDSYYPQRNDSISPDPFAGYPPARSQPLPNPYDATVPLPSPPDHNEELADPGSPTALHSDEQRLSYQDDTDYSHGNRILRVANE